ncbi:Rrp15p-domain-containing protein [Myxozyma melibiosi]|uniref:Rrp15p-domain-containing protein n=1 Tax=Myxozyma melibiosi TaxID=54550 RepID=A0ABR1F866_9ASCO
MAGTKLKNGDSRKRKMTEKKGGVREEEKPKGSVRLAALKRKSTKSAVKNKKRKVVSESEESEAEMPEVDSEQDSNDEFEVDDVSSDGAEISESELKSTANDADESEDDDGADNEDEGDENSDADSESGDDDSDGDEEIEHINAAAHEKQPKKKKNLDPAAFSTAMTAILGSHLKAHDRSDPVLVRSKKAAKEIEDAKLEAKAKRALRMEKKGLLDKERVKDVISGLREGEATDPDAVQKNTEREKKLKKTAKRGVVKLFNTVIEAQKKAIANLAVQA